jgi:prevent-host-death family protein
MRYSTQIKPISYVKAHAAELIARITENREPIIITQNGEARAVLLDVRSYEETQEALAMLQILAIGKKQIETGQTYTLADVAAKVFPQRRQGTGTGVAAKRENAMEEQ